MLEKKEKEKSMLKLKGLPDICPIQNSNSFGCGAENEGKKPK